LLNNLAFFHPVGLFFQEMSGNPDARSSIRHVKYTEKAEGLVFR